MLFPQLILYMSSFVGTLKNEIPGAALELCQLKLKQFSPDILKFSTKHEDNPFTLNCFMVPRTFLFIFHTGSHNFLNSNYKERTAGSACVSRLSFRFLWLCYIIKQQWQYTCIEKCTSPFHKKLDPLWVTFTLNFWNLFMNMIFNKCDFINIQWYICFLN